jgi:uncharacterized protein (TIGR03437 family)
MVNGIAAPLLYVSPNQINFQFPTGAAGSVAQVVVVSNGVSGPPIYAIVAPVMPGIFTIGGRAATQGAVLNEDSSSNSPANPASAGSVIQIFATGLGSTDPPAIAGQPAPATPLSVTLSKPMVIVAGFTAEVLFSGLAPGSVGLYQVNARIPAGIPSGGSVPLQIVIDGNPSNMVSIAVQ